MKYWIGVASRDHVHCGIRGGFCQLGHGKSAPIKRLSPGDWIIYYSPRTALDGGEPVQAFTGIGRIVDRAPYTLDMGNGFVPTRRDVTWSKATDAPICPLIDSLDFIRNKKNWAYVFRFGLVSIPELDFKTIAVAMGSKET